MSEPTFESGQEVMPAAEPKVLTEDDINALFATHATATNTLLLAVSTGFILLM